MALYFFFFQMKRLKIGTGKTREDRRGTEGREEGQMRTMEEQAGGMGKKRGGRTMGEEAIETGE